MYIIMFLVPNDFLSVLDRYTQHGYRVIAIGCKKLPMNYAKVYFDTDEHW